MNKFLTILFCISFTLFILLFSYKTVLALTPTTPAQQQTIDWLYNQNTTNIPPYTTVQQSHLEDVKRVMFRVDIAFYSCIMVITFILLILLQKKKEGTKNILHLIRAASISSSIFILSIILFLSISFNYLFTIFHQIFFPQGNWQFDADSLLIQTFPIEFFSNIGIHIFGTALILAVAPFIILKIRERVGEISKPKSNM
ncbi:DUF1461 domain-containing protein [Candidatus Woesearchaeota archaeon]|nr:DUF1461 domain-containing protein [Candidatus Woesearchaeota archaeon]